jgi:D-tyrosyl-tRNA(Tyr) deacylase
MIALLQRVTEAWVDVDGERIGSIGAGLMVLVGVERDDGALQADRLLDRMLGYRVFGDTAGRMNLGLSDTGGGLLLVPQFTLAADTSNGRRPGFSLAASPEEGEKWFNYLVEKARVKHPLVETGQFGANMQVGLVNDGPVTFWLQVEPG